MQEDAVRTSAVRRHVAYLALRPGAQANADWKGKSLICQSGLSHQHGFNGKQQK